ncbi:small conductance mechanosensitive channel [Anaeroplasma bactoclasticum]|jgi:small conductance mechanosensitive channel|uniref:Small conductance mechanosensitive channel n=1 Tax=Anaeroplasma bactoclasticum TaxID=2088 RepID=A0A397RNM7_9MOLU|nr:mechanosensitive ion channel family protein [Anaeroplasma bactoclasticum]RIA75733.1 small conductance mechanosensitive channel [Anaeroplasma bactoclasticum]
MKNKKLKISVVEIVFWVIGAALLAVIFFRKNIFPDDSIFYNLYEDFGATFTDQATQVLVRIIKTIVIIFAFIVPYRILKFILDLPKKKNQRLMTTISLLQSIIKYASFICVLLFTLAAWGVDPTTLLASAGIVTLIVGLGCQSLIADIISGLFIIFEGDFQVGDTVVIDDWRGVVQAIGLRTTKIVDLAGNVKIVNNSNITDIVNNSKQLSVAICNIDIDYDESIERVESVIEANLDYMRKRIPTIVEGPYYKGIEALGESGVTIKLVAKCNEDDKYQVQRDLNREIKIIFDKNRVIFPFPQVVISEREENNAQNEYKNMDSFVDEQRELSQGFEEGGGGN